MGKLARVAGLLVLFVASSASAVSIDWVTVGDPGNPADTEVMVNTGATGFGSVANIYLIGKYEVTNAQYAEFLNAKAASSDPLGLWSLGLAGGSGFLADIQRTGGSGNYSYAALNHPNRALRFVDFYDALRFANWMHNGQGTGDTETGAYTLLGGTAIPSNGQTVTRNPGARIFLPSEDEWYKAAYYDAVSVSYFDFAAGTDIPTACAAPGQRPTRQTARAHFRGNSLT